MTIVTPEPSTVKRPKKPTALFLPELVFLEPIALNYPKGERPHHIIVL